MAPSAGVPCKDDQTRMISVHHAPKTGPQKPTYLHLGLELVLENPAKFLHIVLHERVCTLPSETLGQLGGPHWLIRALQVIKHSLKSEGKRLGWRIVLGRNLVDCSSEVGSAEEGL